MIVYTNLYEISDLQQIIIRYMLTWVKEEKTPVPQKIIIKDFVRIGSNKSTIIHNLNALMKLGYIRRAIVKPSNRTSYVLLRTV